MILSETGLFILNNDDISKLLDSLPRCLDNYVTVRIAVDKRGYITQTLIEYDSYHKENNYA